MAVHHRQDAGEQIRLAHFENVPAVRAGIRSWLVEDPAVRIIQDDSLGQESIVFARIYQPDVVLVGLFRANDDELEFIRRLRQASPKTGTIAMVSENPPFPNEWISRARELGVSEVILYTARPHEVLDSIHAVGRTKHAVRTNHRQTLHLSRRERQVALLVADGLSNQQIADSFGTSINTVEKQVSSILLKLNVANRQQITRVVVESHEQFGE